MCVEVMWYEVAINCSQGYIEAIVFSKKVKEINLFKQEKDIIRIFKKAFPHLKNIYLSSIGPSETIPTAENIYKGVYIKGVYYNVSRYTRPW